MINETLYNKTVGILVDAYFKDTLNYFDCSRCAVGNIVAGNLGIKPTHGITNKWASAVNIVTKELQIYPSDDGLKQIELTGYSWRQILDIEQAFNVGESIGSSRDEKNFNGLMAVIEVLDQIHQNTDTAITEHSKKRFQKQVAC